MGLKQLLSRELNALQRDIKRRKQRPLALSLSEVRSRMDEYPSLWNRWDYALHKTTRMYEKVRYSPTTIKEYIHRAKYGWNKSDTWSMDYALACQLDGQFESFINRFDEEKSAWLIKSAG